MNFIIQSTIHQKILSNAQPELIPFYFYVIDKINTHRMMYRNGDVCRLCAKKLQQVIPWQYSAKVVRHLQEWDLIELVQEKKIGKFCRGFSIKQHLLNDDYTFAVPSDTIKKRLPKARVNVLYNRHNVTLQRLYCNLKMVTVDTELAYKYLKVVYTLCRLIQDPHTDVRTLIASLFRFNSKCPYPLPNTNDPLPSTNDLHIIHTLNQAASLLFPYHTKDEEEEDEEKHYRITNSQVFDGYPLIKNFVYPYSNDQSLSDHCWIDGLAKRRYFFRRDSYGGRVHTNITNCPKRLRPFLKVEGIDRLAIVDLKNSQPLLLNLVLREKGLGHQKDAILYKDLTEQGNLYEFLMDDLVKPDITRKQFKKDLCSKVLFSNKVTPTPEKEVFKRNFPTVWQVVKAFKRPMAEKKLVQVLQEYESDVVINKICKRLNDKNIWVTTIHDALICDKASVLDVINVVKQEFAANNLSPSVDVKDIEHHQPVGMAKFDAASAI